MLNDAVTIERDTFEIHGGTRFTVSDSRFGGTCEVYSSRDEAIDAASQLASRFGDLVQVRDVGVRCTDGSLLA